MIPQLAVGRNIEKLKPSNPDANGWYDINYGKTPPEGEEYEVRCKKPNGTNGAPIKHQYHIAKLIDGEWKDIYTHTRIHFVTHYRTIIGPIDF